jgi:type VI secretion system protein ImpK
LSVNDPFLPSDSGRTFVLPDANVGGTVATDNPLASLGLGRSTVASDLPDILSGSNPLVKAANHLLNLIPQIRQLVHNANPASLRDYLVSEVRKFENNARESGATPETVIGARYCLCTALDETAAQTPWGGSGIWSKHSLLVTFHNETWGGEKFFQLLSRLVQNPQQHKELLELMYYCIALGFEGRYRIIDNGRTQLDTLRKRLFEILRTANPERATALSPNWKGVATQLRKPWREIPVWVVATVAGLLALMIYTFLNFHLADTASGIFASMNNLRMPRVALAPKAAATPRLAKFLEPEIKEGLVVVRDESDRSVIILRGDGLFESGSATVRERYVPVLSRVAEALSSVKGAVKVTGYSDNTPIRSVRFPSNWQLSEARATTVKGLLEQKVETTRIAAEGRADSDPVAPNDSAENRALNRRVEITLLLNAEELAKQLGDKK